MVSVSAPKFITNRIGRMRHFSVTQILHTDTSLAPFRLEFDWIVFYYQISHTYKLND